MAVTVDYLGLDNRKALVEVVVDPKDKAKGFVILELQDVSWSKWQSLQLELLGAQQSVSRALAAFADKAEHTREQSKAYGDAMQRLVAAQLDVLRWSVSGHQDIFSANGEPIPFDTEKVLFDSVSYDVASAKMLILYSNIGRIPTKPLTFLQEAVQACSRHQIGATQPTAEDRWKES